MKYAFLVLCHKNSTQVNKLLDKLLLFDCEIFVHIDRKNGDLLDDLIKNSNIHYIDYKDSYSISWGGIDMINATLLLMNMAYNFSISNDIKFDYFWLVSGQDYLILEPNKVNNKLKTNLTLNYINVIDKNNKKYYKYNKLYELHYPNWITKDKFTIKLIKRTYMLMTGGFSHTFRLFRRRHPLNYDFYFGSQWWCLNASCVKYIIDFCVNNPEYIDYFKSTIIPDECFFQTILCNSSFKNTLTENLTYVHWGKNRRSPENLLSSDLKFLKKINSSYCFARKFDLDVDSKIFDLIDKKIL